MNNEFSIAFDTTALRGVANERVQRVNATVPTVLNDEQTQRAVSLELAATLVGARSGAWTSPMLTLAQYINDGTTPERKRRKGNRKDVDE